MVVPFNKIPNNLFCNVRKVRDIRQASFIDRKQVKNGEPDIVLVSPLGFKDRVSRRYLVENYCMTDGKKIKLFNMRYKRKYIVITNDNTPMFAFKVPNSKRFKISVENKVVRDGLYILCLCAKNGVIDKRKAMVVSENLFNKMFVIEKKPNLKSIRVGVSTEGLDNKVDNNSSKSNDSRGLVVIKRIIRPDNRKIIGFVVSNGKVAKNCNVGQVMDMCRLKQIKNLTIVSDGGKEYLRGVGIRIENLPSITL